MHCPHCENQIQPPNDKWSLHTPWHCSFCGGMFGIRFDEQKAYALPSTLKPLAPLLGEQVARRFAFYSKPNHYVYALCYSSGLPFYVGIGSGYRCFSHITETQNERRKRWTEKHDIILSLLKTCEGVWYHFLAMVPQRELAASIEGYWVKQFGLRSRGGMLTNSVHPDTSLDDYQDQPPKTENDTEIIKSFQHPDFIVAPKMDGGDSSRSGAVKVCFACGNKGQYVRQMRHVKVLCSHCGHFLVPWTGEHEDGSNRVSFGDEVLLPL